MFNRLKALWRLFFPKIPSIKASEEKINAIMRKRAELKLGSTFSTVDEIKKRREDFKNYKF